MPGPHHPYRTVPPPPSQPPDPRRSPPQAMNSKQPGAAALRRLAMGLGMGLVAGGVLGSTITAMVWTARGEAEGVPFFLMRSLHRGGHHGDSPCAQALEDVTRGWETARFQESQEMNKACDQQMQTLTAEAEQDILALRHKATTDAATTNASGHPSAEVAACEQVLADLQATVPLPPHRLVAADTGIEMMGVVTEARRVAQTLLQDGRPPLATTPNALLLAHGPAYRGPSLSVGAELTMLELQECVETDILLLEPDRCYALVGSETDLPSGSVHEFGWDQDAHKWRRKAQRGPMSAVPPSEHEMAAHEGILRQLYDALPEIDAVLEPLVLDAVPEGPVDWDVVPDIPDRAPTGAGHALLLVVGKDQHVELINQACFKHALMEVKSQGRVLVLAEDEATASLARALGYKRVLTHPALAAVRAVAANDAAVLAWLHLVGAWLLVRKGYDALVHGPEMVWRRHWGEALEGEGAVLASWKHDVAFLAVEEEGGTAHTSPFYPHPCGLWHVHANLRSLHFLQQLLFQQDYALQPHRQPAETLAQVMDDLEQRINLHLLRLSPRDFSPSLDHMLHHLGPQDRLHLYGALVSAKEYDEMTTEGGEGGTLGYWRVVDACRTSSREARVMGHVLASQGPQACCLYEGEGAGR